jgi:hypothetical protein
VAYEWVWVCIPAEFRSDSYVRAAVQERPAPAAAGVIIHALDTGFVHRHARWLMKRMA